MSIWMLLIFALCMLSGMLVVDGAPEWAYFAQTVFVLTLAIFVVGLLTWGIRRPVV